MTAITTMWTESSLRASYTADDTRPCARD